MIVATQADRAAIEDFLITHLSTSMFLLSNLRRYGFAFDHPRAMRFWLRWRSGQLTDVLGRSVEGVILPQCPSAPWGEAAVVLGQHPVKGIIGGSDQVQALRDCLRLDPDPKALDAKDPLFELALSDLIMPDPGGMTLASITQETSAIAAAWRAAYIKEVMPIPGQDPETQAVRDIKMYIERDTHRILYRGGEPVAMTGFNAQEPEAVQVGGVYTPPELRCQGLARCAVALHLAEARGNGVDKAILFAASDNASRAYEAIGFARTGDFSILMYETSQVPHG